MREKKYFSFMKYFWYFSFAGTSLSIMFSGSGLLLLQWLKKEVNQHVRVNTLFHGTSINHILHLVESDQGKIVQVV